MAAVGQDGGGVDRSAPRVLRRRRLPRLIRLLGPLTRRMLQTRLPAGPNVLLTVRGRTSGQPRTVPVAFLDLGERGLLQGSPG